jgi:hypothetical protein
VKTGVNSSSIVLVLTEKRFTELDRLHPRNVQGYRMCSLFILRIRDEVEHVGLIIQNLSTPKPLGLEWGSSSFRRAEITDLR